MMIMQPEIITPALFAQAVSEATARKGQPALSKLRLERLEEGLAAQILYYGPYTGEGPTIIRLHQFIRENGCRNYGKHHEIYLGDPRRTAPDKLRTVLRQPMRKV